MSGLWEKSKDREGGEASASQSLSKDSQISLQEDSKSMKKDPKQIQGTFPNKSQLWDGLWTREVISEATYASLMFVISIRP